MSLDLSQFHRLFFEETAEHLADMETRLLELDLAAPADEDLNAIFRAAHSIKGGAATFGFPDLAEFTHVLENLLDQVRKRQRAATRELVDACLRAGDVLRQMLAGHRDGADKDLAAVEAALDMLTLLGGAAPKSAAPPPVLEDGDGFGFFAPLPEDASNLDIAEEGDGFGLFLPPATDPSIEEGDGFGLFLPIDSPVVPVADTPAAPTAARAKAANSESSSIRVGVEKVDQIITLGGELVITQSLLAQIAGQLDPVLHERLHNGVALLERNTRELQEAAMSIRMMPISFVFSRFPRVVRDLAGKLGKSVNLVTQGEHTELDKGLIEKLADPLTHLVRNSLDHGLESPEARLAKGKPETGTITLSAFHQGGAITIRVADDGAGLNRERILAKARSVGMNVHDGLADADVWSLIFEPGFSTAEQVTDVSGRGVGMDVVRRNIEGLGGRIEIDTQPDQGTAVTIRLPLTLAILDGMTVRVGNEVYVIPLAFIVESLQPRREAINTIAGRGRVIHVRDDYLPLVTLGEVFRTDDCLRDPEAGLVIILESAGGRAALLVDDLLGQQQVVIKSLEANYRKVPGVSGATIMGDGRVALILDVETLVKLSQQDSRAATPQPTPQPS